MCWHRGISMTNQCALKVVGIVEIMRYSETITRLGVISAEADPIGSFVHGGAPGFEVVKESLN